MDAIENIILEINKQAQEERDLLKKNRIEEIDTHFLVSKRAIEEEHQQLLERQNKQLNRDFQQEMNRLVIKARQATLKQKQSYLERIFEEAYQEMAKWTLTEVQSFIFHSLESAKLTTGTIVLGGLMEPNSLTDEWLKDLNQKLNSQFTLGEMSPGKEYGFLVENKGLRYNFFYRELLLELKKKQGSKIMNELFFEEEASN